VGFPIGFGGFHSVDLIGWKCDPKDDRIQTLLRNVESTLLARPAKQNVADKALAVPAFFRSVSSHETAVQPAAAVHALKLVGCDALLISAYDIANEKPEQRDQILADLVSCRSAGSEVLLDSGNYEASRKKDESWCAERLHEALRITPPAPMAGNRVLTVDTELPGRSLAAGTVPTVLRPELRKAVWRAELKCRYRSSPSVSRLISGT